MHFFLINYVKAWWFKLRSRQILEEIQPLASFSFSDGWFRGFKTRFGISLRRATNTGQKQPEDKRSSIQAFHQKIRRTALEVQKVSPLGQWHARNIANMDQTPFTFCDGQTYTDTGEQSV